MMAAHKFPMPTVSSDLTTSARLPPACATRARAELLHQRDRAPASDLSVARVRVELGVARRKGSFCTSRS